MGTAFFAIRASRFFRHSTSVLRHSFNLDQSICADSDEKYPAHERIALKEGTIDSGQIAFFGFVLVNKRCRDQRQRPEVQRAEFRDEPKNDERKKREQM